MKIQRRVTSDQSMAGLGNLGLPRALVIIVILACTPCVPIGAQQDDAPKRVFVEQITTDLQRELIRKEGKDASVIAIVDASTGVILDNNRIQCDELFPELTVQTRNNIAELKGEIIFRVHCTNEAGRSPWAQESLSHILVGFGHASGFDNARMVMSFHNEPLNRENYLLKDLKLPERTEEDMSELPQEVGTVTVYPIQTRLTRMLTGNADCLVSIDDSGFQGNQILDNVPQDLTEAINKVEIDKFSSRIQFVVTVPDGVVNQGALAASIGELAKQVGFEKSSVTFR